MLVRRSFVAALFAALALGAPASAQTRVLVSRLGTDTLSVERFTRSGNTIEGQVVQHSPTTFLISYTIGLNADGTVATMEQTITNGLGAPVPNQPTGARMTFSGDTVVRSMTTNGQPVERRTAVPRGTLPALGLPWSIYEMGVAEARRSGANVYYTMSANPQATAATKWAVSAVRSDSVDVDYFGSPIAFKLDTDGHIVRVDGIRSTNKAVVTPAASADIAAIATAWATKDAAGQAMGAASPRDTARGTIGAASLLVDYGRPAKRGRVIWGTVVPYGAVWRLGANAATQMTIDREIEFEGQKVPAGTYTLWLIPTRDGGTLIVNKQTKQWGTDYDATQDLVRVGVQRARVPGAAERFTIHVEGGELRFQWDDAEYSLHLRSR